MFYKQFLEITDVLNSDFVEDFDYWLATLPRNRQKNITASMIAAKFDVNYSLAEFILKYAEEKKILERYYLVKCPECDDTLAVVSNNELAEILSGYIYCSECDKEEMITTDNIYVAYRVIKQPDVSEEQIYQAIEKRFIQKGNVTENFFQADSLSKNINLLYEEFYHPIESAYLQFKELREKLDLDYGKDTTAKGQSLETLICTIFNKISGVRCTTDIRTKTNQFDCTALCGVRTTTLSIFSYLAPYFIIECKNEPQTKPDNNYCNKLLSIMDTNDAQIGIIFGRMDATSTCFAIARDHYLIHKNSNRHKIIITCSDKDLDYIIDQKVNLLKYLEFKISCITIGSANASYEMYQ